MKNYLYIRLFYLHDKDLGKIKDNPKLTEMFSRKIKISHENVHSDKRMTKHLEEDNGTFISYYKTPGSEAITAHLLIDLDTDKKVLCKQLNLDKKTFEMILNVPDVTDNWTDPYLRNDKSQISYMLSHKHRNADVSTGFVSKKDGIYYMSGQCTCEWCMEDD
jgi:hypothetical protein